MKSLFMFVLSFAMSLSVFAAESDGHATAVKEIKNTFGLVPTFFKEYPESGLEGAWAEFKSIELNPNGAIDAKTRELIGLAVAAQIPCRYCTYFHKKGIQANGGSQEEMNMALALAADSRKWSAYFNGAQLDMTQFKSDVDRMVANAEKNKDQAAMSAPAPLADAKAAMQDIEKTFGFVPEFIKTYPAQALPGAWSNVKAVIISPQVIAAKNKSLINVAVSSQIPCNYCVYIDSQMAKLNGATPAELQEAVAMAGIVRHWSTVLNGLMPEEKAFQREVDSIFSYMKKHQGPAKTKIGANTPDLRRAEK